MSKKSSVSSSSTIPSLVTHAAIQRAQEQLSAIEKELAVGDFLPDPMRGQAQAMRRISAEALRQAVIVVEGHQGRLGVLDLPKARQALDYEAVIAPLVERLRGVAARLDGALTAVWHEPGLQTLAVYGAAKSLDRLPEAQGVRAAFKTLGAELKFHRKGGARAAPAKKPVAPAATPASEAVVATASVGGTISKGVLAQPAA